MYKCFNKQVWKISLAYMKRTTNIKAKYEGQIYITYYKIYV